MQVMQEGPEEQAVVAVIQSTQRGLVDMIQRLVERVEQLEMTSQKNPAPEYNPVNSHQGESKPIEWAQ